MKIIVIRNPETGEVTAFSPADIVMVHGLGSTCTVYLREGSQIRLGGGRDVDDFVQVWARNIDSAPSGG